MDDYNLSLNLAENEWLTNPFIDILVTTAEECPKSHPDPVFTRTFSGTIAGCDCLNSLDVW